MEGELLARYGRENWHNNFCDLVAVVLLVFVMVLLVVLVLCVGKLYHMRKKKQIPRYIV